MGVPSNSHLYSITIIQCWVFEVVPRGHQEHVNPVDNVVGNMEYYPQCNRTQQERSRIGMRQTATGIQQQRSRSERSRGKRSRSTAGLQKECGRNTAEGGRGAIGLWLCPDLDLFGELSCLCLFWDSTGTGTAGTGMDCIGMGGEID